ncbi:MAG: FAD-binding oxidoreductase [Pseudomonadota bacterium]
MKEGLAKIVGQENVLDDPGTLRQYAGDQSFVQPAQPWCVVRPSGTQQVQDLVKWANDKGEPLTPVSSPGGPRFRGDTIPSQGGIVVDLSTMNAILNIDRRDKVAVVEPGVTWNQLEPELRKHGLRAVKPLLPRGTKSVVAGCLEREPIVIPREHWDSLDPLICVEVIFGNGELFRTGSAACPPMDLKEQIKMGLRQVCPHGPGPLNFARVLQGAQGTMGIVTWASVVCGILPEIEKSFFVGSDRIEPVVELAYHLTRRRLGEELFILNNFHLANIFANDATDIAKLAGQLPAWVLALNLTAQGYSTEKRMNYQELDVKDMVQQLGLSLVPSLCGFSAKTLMKLQATPPEAPYKLKFKGGCADIFFTTTMDKSIELIAEAHQDLERHKYPTAELGIYLQPTVQGCNCHCELNLPYDPHNDLETALAKKIDAQTSAALSDKGAFFSRPYGAWADKAFRKDAESTALLRKVKTMYDPKAIMNPGKLCF